MICGWPTAALLRDNAQHWVKSAADAVAYPTVEQLAARAEIGDRRRVDAAALLTELEDLVPRLMAIPGTDAAVSFRSRAILMGLRLPANAAGTKLSKATGWPAAMKVDVTQPLGCAFQRLLQLTTRIAGPPEAIGPRVHWV